MTDTFRCDDKAQLVAYLYDEIDDAARRVDDHLRRCPACAGELAALGGVRHELAGWSPPEVSLGFTVVPAAEAAPPPATLLRPARWWRAAAETTWARAAAAVLVVSAGLSLLNLQIRYDRDGLVISTGWLSRPADAAVAAPAAAVTTTAATAPWRQELAALERALGPNSTRRGRRCRRPGRPGARSRPSASRP